jgi:pimeloyl-ACP methyl ester carboxylesterase
MQPDQTDIVQRYRPLAELVPAHWQSGAITTGDGARIHYTRTGGAKPALLLIHGVQASGLMWLRTAQALETAYDIVMPDVRGHGQSSRMAATLARDRLVEDLAVLLRALGVERPFVAGHSMGAELAGRLAAAYPVRAVALVDPALRNVASAIAFDPDNPPPWMAPIVQAMQALSHQPHAERLQTGLRLLPPGTTPWQEADYVSFVDGLAQFDQGFYRHAARLGYLIEEQTTIARIDCPILLMTARPMMPGADIDAGVAVFEQSWRDGRRVHFPDSGHFIPFDQFERFVAVLAGFLQKTCHLS